MTYRLFIFLFFIGIHVDAQETLYPIQENGKWGFINKEGVLIIRPQFAWDHAYSPENGFIITETNGKYGLLNSYGEPLFDPQFDQPPEFHGRVAWVKKDELWGLIDHNGLWLIEPAFETVYGFNNGYAKIEKNGKYGLVDSSGIIVIEPVFMEMSYPSEGFIAVDADGGWGYIDTQGEFVIKPRFGSAYDFHSGYALVIVNYNRWRIIDKSGNFTTEKEFDYLGECGDGLFYAEFGYDKGIVDHAGEFVLKSVSCRYYNRNLIQYEENEKIGFRNREGRILLKPQFVMADDIGNGWIAVIDEKNRLGFIDSLGNIKLPLQNEFYIDLSSDAKFKEERLVVRNKKKVGVIDKNLQWVVKPTYESISSFKNGWAVFNRGGKLEGEFGTLNGGKYGFIDRNGHTITEPVFEQVFHLGKELAQVQIGSFKAYVDRQGKIVWKQR
ncbi:WG repeat-containing protein [bacterium]|nr:MAG: WG repeat-containing protein [bacterium]